MIEVVRAAAASFCLIPIALAAEAAVERLDCKVESSGAGAGLGPSALLDWRFRLDFDEARLAAKVTDRNTDLDDEGGAPTKVDLHSRNEYRLSWTVFALDRNRGVEFHSLVYQLIYDASRRSFVAYVTSPGQTGTVRAAGKCNPVRG